MFIGQRMSSVRRIGIAVVVIAGAIAGSARAGTGAEVLSRKYNDLKHLLAKEKTALDAVVAGYNKLQPRIQTVNEQIAQTRKSLQEAQFQDARQAKIEQQAIDTDPKLVTALKKHAAAQATYKEAERRAVDKLLHGADYETADLKTKEQMRRKTLEEGEVAKLRQAMNDAAREAEDVRDQVARAYRKENPQINTQKEWRQRMAELERQSAELRIESDRYKAEIIRRTRVVETIDYDLKGVEKTAAAAKIKLVNASPDKKEEPKKNGKK
jgi:chromosome segregation ATPase